MALLLRHLLWLQYASARVNFHSHDGTKIRWMVPSCPPYTNIVHQHRTNANIIEFNLFIYFRLRYNAFSFPHPIPLVPIKIFILKAFSIFYRGTQESNGKWLDQQKNIFRLGRISAFRYDAKHSISLLSKPFEHLVFNANSFYGCVLNWIFGFIFYSSVN